MPTYLNYDSREEFVRSLNLFHYNKTIKHTEFNVVSGLCNGFETELEYIKENLNFIKANWNNQSIEQIESAVANLGPRHLDIMAGQKK